MKTKIVHPEPFFEVRTGMSNRRFYEIKDKLWRLCCAVDPDQEKDYWNAYRSESCDYEGDLDKITIYNCIDIKDWVDLILKEFKIKDKVPESMNIVFTVY